MWKQVLTEIFVNPFITVFSTRLLLKTYTYNYSRTETYDYLLNKIESIELEVIEGLRHQGIIVVKCIFIAVNWIVRVYYADKFRIEIERISENQSAVNIYAIKSWRRYKVNKDEKLYEIDQIIPKLKRPIKNVK